MKQMNIKDHAGKRKILIFYKQLAILGVNTIK